MSWLKYVGDTDILRDAVRPSAVFWYRFRRGWVWDLVGLGLTLLLVGATALMALGPESTGVRWLQREVVAVIVGLLGATWVAYLGYLVFKFLPGRNDRVVIGLRDFVRTGVDPLEAEIEALSPEALRAKTAEFRQRLADGEAAEALRAEAYACVREASRRAQAHRQFECQLIGGRVLEDGNVAEMRTGEGKTIVCYMGNYMQVLQGLRVHMVTVNDYLVKRDAEFAQPIFDLLGVSVGYISADMETFGPGVEVRRQAYACDITYGTNSEFGFDYLRDNMKHTTRDQVQGQQDYVVVDEVDSILIDEARTPLIISGPARDDVNNYRIADNVARMLIQKQEQANRQTAGRIDALEQNPPPEMRQNPKFAGALKKFRTDPFWLSSDEGDAIGHLQYFVVELDRKSAHMTEHGAKAAQAELSIGSFYDSKNMNWPHYIDNAVRAHLCYEKDREYVIQDDQIVIVDEFTGRLMHGRQWSDGLHQAVEAKEKVTIKQESQTLATITLQNLFKLYQRLAGMTGTAMTEADEFMKIYGLEVIAIPTNQPIRRIDYNDKIYKSAESKFDALVEEIRAMSAEGYPSDPYSLEDMLKIARTTLREAQLAGLAGKEVEADIETINRGLKDFNGGKGAEQILADTYLKIMGGEVRGRPLLVGTVSVEASEKLSEALTRKYGVDHEVLNAKNHAREAEIVAKAGQQHEQVRGKKKRMVGNVTIATNMAGRGTDIRLGAGVVTDGGLHVIGTERHESRRIDNQLRGRCGRQGDPGSSRFFLSMQDDLLRLFMGEWMLKMLNVLGFEEGMAIEDKRLSRGIEKAQKKVEERNFGIRKNLLEYDEVMDHQRKSFYELRQRVVEGRGLSELIWNAIDESVADAVDRYFDPNYARSCVAEWVAQHLTAHIDPGRLDTSDFSTLCDQVRDQAANDVRSNAQRMFGEYIDETADPEEWDVRGFVQWAGGFDFSITQNQVKKANPGELLDQVTEAAEAKVQAADLTPLERFADARLPRERLAQWCKDKFDVEVPVDELVTAQREDAETIIREQMRAAYRQREIEYPVGAVIDFALRRGGQNRNEVYEVITRWANRKYQLDWTYEHFSGKSPEQIYQELKAVNEDYLTNGKLETEIDTALQQHDEAELDEWAQQRFGAVMEINPLDRAGDLRAQLKQCGYEMLRFELTQLERYVLLQTLDSIWKDHMYAMDILRHGIGLRGYAQQDPKIEYKREGTRLFNEMQENIRERVTDLIFKVRISGFGDFGDGSGDGQGVAEAGGPNPLAAATTSHADATNAGLVGAAASADQEAALRKQGEAGKPQTIRREEPKVGRNDPCPCGSGKKYKQIGRAHV
jgi:preprotein translocase subunit SecA